MLNTNNDIEFDDQNPITLKMIADDCRRISHELSQDVEPLVYEHFYETLIGFDFMCEPAEDERKALYDEFLNILNDKALAIKKAKRMIVLLFIYKNF